MYRILFNNDSPSNVSMRLNPVIQLQRNEKTPLCALLRSLSFSEKCWSSYSEKLELRHEAVIRLLDMCDSCTSCLKAILRSHGFSTVITPGNSLNSFNSVQLSVTCYEAEP